MAKNSAADATWNHEEEERNHMSNGFDNVFIFISNRRMVFGNESESDNQGCKIDIPDTKPCKILMMNQNNTGGNTSR
jgi:hypothetical protein